MILENNCSEKFSAYENQNYHGRMPTNGLSFGTKKVDLSLNTASLEPIFMKNTSRVSFAHLWGIIGTHALGNITLVRYFWRT